MEIPEGIENYNALKDKFVCKLNKALYELKTSPKKWNIKFREEMIKYGLTLCDKESCVYYKRSKEKLLILTLYVDDIIILSNCNKEMQRIIEYLENTSEMVSMGEPKKYLGMEIERDPEKQIIRLHQTQYIRKILKRFLMHECNPCRTPMVATAM